MGDQYCIAMMNNQRINEQHTLPLFLEGKDKPVLFKSIDKAVESAKYLKQWHPEINFEVYEFYKHCEYAFEIMEYGTWMISKDPVSRI